MHRESKFTENRQLYTAQLPKTPSILLTSHCMTLGQSLHINERYLKIAWPAAEGETAEQAAYFIQI